MTINLRLKINLRLTTNLINNFVTGKLVSLFVKYNSDLIVPAVEVCPLDDVAPLVDVCPLMELGPPVDVCPPAEV